MKKKSHLQQQQQKNRNTINSSNKTCLTFILNLFSNQPNQPNQPKQQSQKQKQQKAMCHQSMPVETLAAKKRNRQDNQLTLMTICVALLYIACSVPMCLIILLPSLVWKTNVTDTHEYKHFAAICNSLELFQCLVRFFIYYFFTTQFRVELHRRYLCWPRLSSSRPTLAKAATEHLVLLNIRSPSIDDNNNNNNNNNVVKERDTDGIIIMEPSFSRC